MQHARLIDHLGGWRVVARKLNVAPTTVWRWQENGIPAERWPAVLQLAKRVGLVVTVDQLLRASPVVRRKAGATKPKDDLARAS
jgi:hypothetical protein